MRGKPCFVDTNIWLYVFIKSEDNDKTAVADQLIKSQGKIGTLPNKVQ